MDVCESNQALETPRPPLVPAEKNNGPTCRPRTKEVSSRYKSPTPRRCPSPNTTRTVTAPSVPIPKRAVSAERRRPATPPSPPSPSTPVHETSVDTELTAKKVPGCKLPESLWPSRMRSLSVSFQSDTFSLPISKREKPPPQALSDRILKPSSNVTHKQNVTPPASRKTTPERKRSPLKGKNCIDHSENSRPLDGLSARLVDHHRWPSTTRSNVRSKSIEIPDQVFKTLITPNPGVRVPSRRRMSLPDCTVPLHKSKSDAESLLSSIVDNERLKFDNSLRICDLVSSSSEKPALVTPAVRSRSLPSPGSRPSSPNKFGLASRGVTPSQSRASTPAPSRGVSPSRIRSSSPSRQPSNSNPVSVLTFIADIKKGKKVANHIEDAHCLRLLYNRQVQWRFANAGAEAVLNSQKVTAEKAVFNVWRTTSELRDSVAAKRIDLYRLRLQLKLNSVLNEQMDYLNEWASVEKEHNVALSGAIEDVQASTLRLPVTGGAMADIGNVKLAIGSAVQVMQTMGSSIYSTLSRLEETNCVVSELATVVAQERALLDECEALLSSAAALQVEEYSLRTHLIQLKEAWKSV